MFLSGLSLKKFVNSLRVKVFIVQSSAPALIYNPRVYSDTTPNAKKLMT